MNRRFLTVAATCAALVSATAAHAQTPAANGAQRGQRLQQLESEMFKRMDTNGDGVISKQEFMEQAEKRFKRLDANGDGQITREEIESAAQNMRQRAGAGGGGAQFP